MLTTKFQTIYIGLIFFVFLLKLSISNPLPTTTTTESSSTSASDESNIISFLNQPGHGRTHLGTNNNNNNDENKDEIDEDNLIKPLDDIFGLNFDLFDTWAKNSNNSKGSSSSSSSSNNNTDSFNISSTTITPEDNNSNNINVKNNNENKSTEHGTFFTQNRPLQRFHNTLHRIFSSISNRISNIIEQRDDDGMLQHQRELYRQRQMQKHQQHHYQQINNNNNNSERKNQKTNPNSSINLTQSNEKNVVNGNDIDNNNSSDNVIRNNSNHHSENSTQINEKNQFENEHQSATNEIKSAPISTTAALTKNQNYNNYRSSRLIDNSNSSSKESTLNNNNLFMRSSTSTNGTQLYDPNTIIDPNHIIVTMKNITIDVNNLYTTESSIIPDDDLLNLDEDDDDMNKMPNNNNNNLFITTTGFRNKTRAFITFIFTPLSNLWSIAQRNLPIWLLNNIRTNNNNNMKEDTFTITSSQNNIEADKDTNKNDTDATPTYADRIPSILSRIRQSVSLPFYQNNDNHSIRSVYRRINERMPFRKEFRKYVTPVDDLIVNDHFESTTASGTVAENRHLRLIDQSSKEGHNGLGKTTDKNLNVNHNNNNDNHDDNDDDDDDDDNVVILNSKEDDEEIKHMKPPVSASPRVYSESLGIYILELFGTIVGLTWGALSTIQNLFTKS